MKQKESGSKKERLVIEPRIAGIVLFKVPIKPEEINELGRQMVEWCYTNPTAVDLAAYPLSLNVSPYRFYQLSIKSEYFSSCLELSRAMIAFRLQKHWRDGTLAAEYCRFELLRYDASFKKEVMDLRIAQQNAMNQGIMNFKTVEVPAIPDSPKVRKIEK